MSIIDILKDEGVRHPRGIVTLSLLSVFQPACIIPLGAIIAILADNACLALFGLLVSGLLLILGVNVAEAIMEYEIRRD